MQAVPLLAECKDERWSLEDTVHQNYTAVVAILGIAACDEWIPEYEIGQAVSRNEYPR